MKNIICICVFIFSMSLQAQNWSIALKLGPSSFGSGGPNPVSLPPLDLTDYEIKLTSPSEKTYHMGITPIIIGIGQQFNLKYNIYHNFGAALLSSSQTIGGGVYWEAGIATPKIWKKIYFNFSYTQTAGFGVSDFNKLIFPYSIRVGLGVNL